MATYAAEVLADNPLLYLRFDEAVLQYCENQGSLAGYATAAGTYTRNYSTGLAAGLDIGVDIGSSSGIFTYPDTASLDLTGDFTYECWINADSLQSAVLISKGSDSSGSTGGYELQARAAGNIRIIQSSVAILATGSVGAYAAGTWSHQVVTRSGNDYKIYSNGALTDTATGITTTINATAKSLCVGGQDIGGGPTGVYDGKIDEVAVYGTALSAARIAAHYAAQSTGLTYFGGRSGSSGTVCGANFVYFFPATATATGNITNWRVHYGGSGGTNAKMGIYSDSAGSPASKLGESSAVSFSGKVGFISGTFATPVAVTSGTPYWLAFFCNGSNPTMFCLSSGSYNYLSATYPTFPSSAAGFSSSTNLLMNLQAGIAASGGGGSTFVPQTIIIA